MMRSPRGENLRTFCESGEKKLLRLLERFFGGDDP